MTTKINLIVTVTDDKDAPSDLVEHTKTIESFCRIKNQNGCSLNGKILTFEINPKGIFHIEE